MWNDKRYHSLNYELKKTFGEKVVKLSLDGGFTCPNRDGLVGERGCLFCSEKGSGDFAGSRHLSLEAQMAQQRELLRAKWPKAKYLAYLQSFTNTYAPVEVLRRIYGEAIAPDDVVGLALATRPDCLPGEVLDLLEEYAQKTYLWVELGLQTIQASTTKLLRTGYELQEFVETVQRLQARQIQVVVHLILGLPGETVEDMLESVQFVGRLGVWGVKLHSLYIQKDSDLYDYYMENPFPIFTMEEYIKLVCDALELLPPDLVIHRLMGDGDRKLLEAPQWSTQKRRVLSGIDQEMRNRNTLQGQKWNGGE